MPKGVPRGRAQIVYKTDCVDCRKKIGPKNSSGLCASCAHKRNPNRYWLGKKRPDLAEWQRGRKFSEETKKRLSESHMGNPSYWKGRKRPDMVGEKHPNWVGGAIKHPDSRIRNSSLYKEWRKHVYQRDDYTCQSCGKRGGTLNADHELPFALYPDLRFEVLNGRTLCLGCHKETETFGGKARRAKKEFALAL